MNLLTCAALTTSQTHHMFEGTNMTHASIRPKTFPTGSGSRCSIPKWLMSTPGRGTRSALPEPGPLAPAHARLDARPADRGTAGRRRPHCRLLRALAFDRPHSETVHRRRPGRFPDRCATGIVQGLAQSADRD